MKFKALEHVFIVTDMQLEEYNDLCGRFPSMGWEDQLIMPSDVLKEFKEQYTADEVLPTPSTESTLLERLAIEQAATLRLTALAKNWALVTHKKELRRQLELMLKIDYPSVYVDDTRREAVVAAAMNETRE